MTKPSFGIVRSDRCERELDLVTGTNEPKTVSIPLGKIVPLLVDAHQRNRAWIDDFADDLIRIDADLYQVLLAYDELSGRAA